MGIVPYQRFGESKIRFGNMPFHTFGQILHKLDNPNWESAKFDKSDYFMSGLKGVETIQN